MASILKLASKTGDFSAYLSTPQGQVKGGVLVIHEVWGLVGHIENIADRFSQAGYIALAPNLLTETRLEHQLSADLQLLLFNPATRSAVQPKIRQLMAPLRNPEFAKIMLARTIDSFNFLYDHPETRAAVSSVGFCLGGTYSFSLAVHEPRLQAAVPFYGHADFSIAELEPINCPILAFYGQNDENLIQDLPQLKQKMATAKVDFQAKVFSGCGHAFFNDSNPYTYNKKAADQAWQQTLNFLELSN